jgi:thymidylate synthase
LELAVILSQVAAELDRSIGSLTMIVKSAHVYDSDASYMSLVLQNFNG